jgi:hypothetical protein
MWYQTMGLVQQEDVQRKGVVVVLYSVGLPPSAVFDFEFMRMGSSLPRALPIRLVLHYCYDDYRLTPVINLTRFGTGKNARLRFRTHFGECCCF